MRTLLLLLALAPMWAAGLEISRPARTWEFLDATGPRSAFFGKEDGTLEAYVYPLKVLGGLHLRFRVGARLIPGEAVVRNITSRPGSYTLTYSGDEFQVEQTIASSPTEPGLLLHLAVRSYEPVTIEGEFTRDFQLMWPASIGSSYAEWNADSKAWFFGADGHPFAAVFGGPEVALRDAEYATNYSADRSYLFTLGSINGRGDRWLAIAGSVKSRDDAIAAWKRLLAHPAATIAAAEQAATSYLGRTVELDLPDPVLQRAYDWSRLSVWKGMVDNPFLGRGLVAGYGLSKGAYRPGFAWFFGRDSFWTSFALTAAGDLDSARTAIDFVAKYQRDDGKIPHEISQSASLVPWFTAFPYGYASADATPLFVIAVRDYVQASGDVGFARKHLNALNKAFDFMRSTIGETGYPRNFDVGHGWVEGGPLLPVEVELYHAACYVKALESMAKLSSLAGDTARAAQFDSEYKTRRAGLERFWLAANGTYAFAIGRDGQPVNEPSVLATVPMWFGVLDPAKSQRMIETLAHEEHATDWGMRIIGAGSPKFGPAGYHFGSVWPLFTGWAAVGEYRSHMAAPAYENLRANAWLAIDGAGGNTTEVLSGATYSPLSTSSPHQIWSAAMVVSPLLRGLMGLETDATARRLTFAPHLPDAWDHAAVKRISIGNSSVSLMLRRTARQDVLEAVLTGGAPVELEFSPAYNPWTTVSAIKLNNSPVEWNRRDHGTDWHADAIVKLNPGRNEIAIDRSERFGYTVPWNPPLLAHASQNLKVISERWLPDSLELRVSGLAAHDYAIALNDGRAVAIHIPEQGTGYAGTAVRISRRP